MIGPNALDTPFCSLPSISKKKLGAAVEKWQQYAMGSQMVDKAIPQKKNFIEQIQIHIFSDQK